jgi:hypothetical protein
MSDNIATTSSSYADLIATIRGWLTGQIDQLMPQLLTTRQAPPASMTDEQLHEAVYRVGAELLNNISVHVLMPTYARNGVRPDPRFPHGIPTTVRDHVLTMFTSAHDSFGLSVIGLQKHATAAALGPIRNVAETLTLTRWLLDCPSEADRQGRAYRLTLGAIDRFREDARLLKKVSSHDTPALKGAEWMADSADQMARELEAMAQQDQITIASKPPKPSIRAAQFGSGTDGYMLYALTSAAGVHPGAQRAVLFYGNPGTRIMDFDFKGMHAVRAYWIAVSIELHLQLCRLAVPVLGWQKWEAAFDALDGKLRSLAEEAQRRFAEPHLRAWQQRVASGQAPDIF